MRRSALALVLGLASAPLPASAQTPSTDLLSPRGLVDEHVLEQRWSEGGGWRLLPAPAIPLHIHIRVGENYQVRAIRADGSEVLVVWLPHAGGTATGSEIVARLVARRGWAVASLLPPPDLPPPGAAIGEWVSLVEERVRAGREALAMARSEKRRCVALLGVSAGGIAALRVAELEPEVDVVVAMLAGTGSEGLLHAARSYGAASAPPSRELTSRINALDPAKHAAGLGGRSRMLIRARFDDVIPAKSFETLRLALGEPEVQSYPTGHETFVYVMPFAVESALDWVAKACHDRKRAFPAR